MREMFSKSRVIIILYFLNVTSRLIFHIIKNPPTLNTPHFALMLIQKSTTVYTLICHVILMIFFLHHRRFYAVPNMSTRRKLYIPKYNACTYRIINYHFLSPHFYVNFIWKNILISSRFFNVDFSCSSFEHTYSIYRVDSLKVLELFWKNSRKKTRAHTYT